MQNKESEFFKNKEAVDFSKISHRKFFFETEKMFFQVQKKKKHCKTDFSLKDLKKLFLKLFEIMFFVYFIYSVKSVKIIELTK